MYLVIGEQSVALGSKEVVVPDTQHAHHHGNLIKNTHTHDAISCTNLKTVCVKLTLCSSGVVRKCSSCEEIAIRKKIEKN